MNSKQRRQIERKYTHSIKLEVQDERYYYFDKRVEEARHWCNVKFGKGNWIRKASWNHSIFCFIEERDAVYFGLIWL